MMEGGPSFRTAGGDNKERALLLKGISYQLLAINVKLLKHFAEGKVQVFDKSNRFSNQHLFS
jgi:hypothetical protein